MRYSILLLLLFLGVSCNKNFHVVYPSLETDPVESTEDAADDIAIFVHPNNPEKQAIIGTNKQKGLVVYNNQGKVLHNYPFGRINNVDLRQNIPWNGDKICIVGGSNRTDNSLVFYELNEDDLSLQALHQTPITSSVNEVYGFCMYLREETCYAFVVGKDGVIEQWELMPNPESSLAAKMVRSFDVGGQCEGLVADDEFAQLYVGEEEVGVWKYSAKPEDGSQRIALDQIKSNKQLKADIEGLSIYPQAAGEGYLLVSSQGNNSYAVYERHGANKYLGSFKIKGNAQYGGTSDTDGIDVTAQTFGSFDKGVFIAQDGHNGKQNQNFKLVDFGAIEKIFLDKN